MQSCNQDSLPVADPPSDRYVYYGCFLLRVKMNLISTAHSAAYHQRYYSYGPPPPIPPRSICPDYQPPMFFPKGMVAPIVTMMTKRQLTRTSPQPVLIASQVNLLACS